MMPDTNENLLERFYAAIENRQTREVQSMLAPDVTVHVGGAGRFSGEYRGREAALGLYETFMQAMPHGFKFPAHDVLWNRRSIVVLPKAARFETAQLGMDVYHVTDGRFAEVWLTEWGAASEPSEHS